MKQQGCIERLSLAKSREGLVGNEAIAYARTWAFYDPSAGAWQAAVFNNDPSRIEADQRRRMTAIANTLVLLSRQIDDSQSQITQEVPRCNCFLLA